MDLSKDTVKGLVNIQDKNNVSDDIFIQTIEHVISYICRNTVEPKSIAKTPDSKPSVTKSMFANVACLFVEAARHDLNEESLLSFLDGVRISGQRAEKLCDAYMNSKNSIQTQLQLIGYNPLHVVDVDWRLDYCIKYDTCNSVGVSLYHIRLNTKKHEGTKSITFTCTIQQLQELVSKLKDAIRHLEKLINT